MLVLYLIALQLLANPVQGTIDDDIDSSYQVLFSRDYVESPIGADQVKNDLKTLEDLLRNRPDDARRTDVNLVLSLNEEPSCDTDDLDRRSLIIHEYYLNYPNLANYLKTSSIETLNKCTEVISNGEELGSLELLELTKIVQRYYRLANDQRGDGPLIELDFHSLYKGILEYMNGKYGQDFMIQKENEDMKAYINRYEAAIKPGIIIPCEKIKEKYFKLTSLWTNLVTARDINGHAPLTPEAIKLVNITEVCEIFQLDTPIEFLHHIQLDPTGSGMIYKARDSPNEPSTSLGAGLERISIHPRSPLELLMNDVLVEEDVDGAESSEQARKRTEHCAETIEGILRQIDETSILSKETLKLLDDAADRINHNRLLNNEPSLLLKTATDDELFQFVYPSNGDETPRTPRSSLNQDYEDSLIDRILRADLEANQEVTRAESENKNISIEEICKILYDKDFSFQLISNRVDLLIEAMNGQEELNKLSEISRQWILRARVCDAIIFINSPSESEEELDMEDVD